MSRNVCAVDTPSENNTDATSSVMFCDLHLFAQNTDFRLPPGDQIAFKKQYEKMIEKIEKKSTLKADRKEELSIKSAQRQLFINSCVPSSCPTVSFFSASKVSGLLAANTISWLSFPEGLVNYLMLATGIGLAAYLYSCWSSNQPHLKTIHDQQLIGTFQVKLLTLQKNCCQLNFDYLQKTNFFTDVIDFVTENMCKKNSSLFYKLQLLSKSKTITATQLTEIQHKLDRLEKIITELTHHYNKLQMLEQEAKSFNRFLIQHGKTVPKFGVIFNSVNKEFRLATSYENEEPTKSFSCSL